MSGFKIKSLEAQIRDDFENLEVGDLRITSDKTPNYNCIAWAMGEYEAFWWPSSESYWPEDAPNDATVEAFTAAFATKGFSPCRDGKPVSGKEKVALYTKEGKPTHAAFLLDSGEWASKLGSNHDVEHRNLDCISGKGYGKATHFYERDTPATPRPKMSNVVYEFAKQNKITNETLGIKPQKASKIKRGAAKKSH